MEESCRRGRRERYSFLLELLFFDGGEGEGWVWGGSSCFSFSFFFLGVGEVRPHPTGLPSLLLMFKEQLLADGGLLKQL